MDLTGCKSPMDAVRQGIPDDLNVEFGSPSAGGNYVPALPPIADVMPAQPTMADLEIFGKFEFCGEVDSATSCHMVAFWTVFCSWYKSKNCCILYLANLSCVGRWIVLHLVTWLHFGLCFVVGTKAKITQQH